MSKSSNAEAQIEKPTKPSSWKAFALSRAKWQRPFYAFEFICEWLVYFSKRWAFVEVLEIAGKFTILVSVVIFILTAGERRQAAKDQKEAKEYARVAKQFSAWQMLAAANGKKADFGRAQAIAFLNSEGVVLDPLDLSDATIFGLALRTNQLHSATFQRGDFTRPLFDQVKVGNSIFSTSRWDYGTFTNCLIHDSDFRGAEFNECDFRNTEIEGPAAGVAGDKRTTFLKCDMRKVTFKAASLTNMEFQECDLTDAKLIATMEWDHVSSSVPPKAPEPREWLPAKMTDCNLYGAELPHGFFNFATNQLGAVSLKPEDYRSYKRAIHPYRRGP